MLPAPTGALRVPTKTRLGSRTKKCLNYISFIYDWVSGLGVFGVATSTCDLHGDGDAVAFPVVSTIIPLVEQILLARSTQFPSTSTGARTLPGPATKGVEPLPSSYIPPRAVLENITGQYCSTEQSEALLVRVEGPPNGQHLVMRPASNTTHQYSKRRMIKSPLFQNGAFI